MKNTFSYLTIILFVALGVVGISIIYIYTQPTERLPLYEPAQSIASPSTTERSSESTTLAAERAKNTTHSINVSLGPSDSSYTGSTNSTNSTSSKSSYTGSTSYTTNHYSGSTSSYSTRKSTSSKSSPYAAYDAGYEDVYDNDDYDLDRYNSDRDYADGVDDAMDDMEDGDW